MPQRKKEKRQRKKTKTSVKKLCGFCDSVVKKTTKARRTQRMPQRKIENKTAVKNLCDNIVKINHKTCPDPWEAQRTQKMQRKVFVMKKILCEKPYVPSVSPEGVFRSFLFSTGTQLFAPRW